MNDVDSAADVIAMACLLLGAFLCLTAGLGLLRFPDVLSRMHAGTKPQAVGVLLIMVGSAIRLTGSSVVWMLLRSGTGDGRDLGLPVAAEDREAGS